MVNMDLIPEDYRQFVDTQRKVRHFIAACMVVVCVIGLAKVMFSYLIWRESTKVVTLEHQEQVSQQNKSKIEALRQQKLVAEQQLTALAALRGNERVTHFLQAIDHAYTEGVWFDNLRFMRRSDLDVLNQKNITINESNSVVPNAAESTQPIETHHGAEIIGHAINHSMLAEFMRQLGAEKSVSDLRLIDTGTRAYTTLQVVDFSLDLQMNESKKRVGALTP